MLHRSVSAVIWALPFCPSPFLPHISAAYFPVRCAECTFSARSISLGWLIQFSKSFCEGLLYNPYTYSILKGVFGNQILKFHKNIFSSGCQKVLPECYRYKDNSRFSRSWGFFSLSARFAHSRSKLTFVVFPGWQSWWGFRSPFPRYAQNLGFWLSGSTWMCSQPNAYGLSGVALQL